MKLSFFTRFFPNAIETRGKIYWQRGRVNVTSYDGKTYTATVVGTQNYTTTVTMDGDEIVDSSCDCPYGSHCKHVAALMFEIRDRRKKNKDVLQTPAPQMMEKKEVEDKVYPRVEIFGQELEAKEFFLLCAITYAGRLDKVEFTTVPVSISRSWKFTERERDNLARKLYDKHLVKKAAAYYYFGNDSYEVATAFYFRVIKKMMEEYEPWLDFFKKKLKQSDTNSYLFSVTQEFYVKKKPSRVPLTFSKHDIYSLSEVQIAIPSLLREENAAEKLCTILEDDILCPVMETLIVKTINPSLMPC